MTKLFLVTGSLNAAAAVILGAFGAHGLKERLTTDMLSVYQTGVQYHFYHALGLILIGILAFHLPSSTWLRCSGWLMLTGIILFSGSLYLLSVTKLRWLGMITPLGGLAFILSWLLLTYAVLKSQ